MGMNDRVFTQFGIRPDDPLWSDWHWQFKNRIRQVDELARVVSLDEQAMQDIHACLAHFRMAITPYYASLMDPDDVSCPIRLQAIPSRPATLRECNWLTWVMKPL